MEISQQKALLRNSIRREKQLFSAKERKWQSEHIFRRIEALNIFSLSETLLLYASLPDEPDTYPLFSSWSHKTLLLPVIQDDQLIVKKFSEKEGFRKGVLNIDEPRGDCFTEYGEIGLALIPGVAFTKQGKRLGRGKGYYDRFLPRLTHTLKLGIGFDFQLVEEIPSAPWDVNLDGVVTASGCWIFSDR